MKPEPKLYTIMDEDDQFCVGGTVHTSIEDAKQEATDRSEEREETVLVMELVPRRTSVLRQED